MELPNHILVKNMVRHTWKVAEDSSTVEAGMAGNLENYPEQIVASCS